MKAKTKKPTGTGARLSIWLKDLYKSVWLFPAILTVILLSLTALQIHGSSIGSYHSIFYGSQKDPNLLLNKPEAIRSDEWLVTTQLTIAQHAAGYPKVNPNIDSGRDMSVVGDAPYKDWSMVFKPQNLSFFVLPFASAFAFKWWLLLFLTIVSCYFLTLRFLPGKRLFAALFGTAIGCSPFIFWWYATGTMAPLFYGFFSIIIGMRIINGESISLLGGRFKKYSTAIYVATLTYILTCFALILYPPFQVPVALAVAAFLAGYLLDKHGFGKQLLSRPVLKQIGAFGLAIALTLLFIAAFFVTRSDVVHAIQDSAYPGKRSIKAGDYPVHEVFTTYLQPELQSISHAANYYTNQSEASQFILLLPFLLIPGFVLIYYQYRNKHRLNWPLLMVQLCAILFFTNLFVAAFQPLYKILLLDQVQHGRIFIGLGFLGILQTLLIIRDLDGVKIRQKTLDMISGEYFLLCLAILAWAGLYTHNHWPIFAGSQWVVSGLGLLFGAIIFCFLTRRPRLGVLLLLVLTLGSVFHIHPLYRGMGPYYDGALSQAIKRVSKPGDSWVNVDNLVFENAPLVNGRDSVSGIKPYPDVKYWRQVEGAGPHNKNDYVYNRYAHVLFTTDNTVKENLHLFGPDTFGVKFRCSPFITKHVDFALANHTLDYPCVHKVEEVRYPAITFYIYEIR